MIKIGQTDLLLRAINALVTFILSIQYVYTIHLNEKLTAKLLTNLELKKICYKEPQRGSFDCLAFPSP